MRKKNLSEKKNTAGQAFLSTILIIGGIMIVVSAAVAILAATFIDSGYGLQASNKAESVATAGVNDGFMRLVRLSSYSGAYAVTVPSGSASVVVSNSGASATVTSSSTINGRTRKINAVFSVSSSTGQVTLVSWQDVQ